MIENFIDQLLHPTPVTLMAEIIVGLLIVGTLAIELANRIWSGLPMKELRARTYSWWIMVALFLFVLFVHTTVSIIAIALLSYLALKEFYTLVHLRIADRRAVLLAYLSIPVQAWWVYTHWYGMFLIFVPVYMFLVISFRLVVAGETQRFMTSAGKLHWGLMAFVYGLGYLAYLLVIDLNPELQFTAGNAALLLYLVFLAEFNDILQYLFGKTLGKHKLAPTVSPNKTWEGFLGGLVCTSLLAVLLRFLTPMDVWYALGAGAIIGVTGPIGGLVTSAIKRDVGVKDSGTLIPGHGGILDRVDSLCFSAPVFFHYLYNFYG